MFKSHITQSVFSPPANRQSLIHSVKLMELGKPNAFHNCYGNFLARGSDSVVGIGLRKKQMPSCNAKDREISPPSKDGRLPFGLSLDLH